MTFSLLIFSFASLVLQDSEMSEVKRDVENFDMGVGFAYTFNLNFVDKFIELVPDQKKEIVEIRRDYTLKGKNVIRNDLLSYEKRHRRLVELRKEQNSKIREVLLPEQLDRLESYKFYSAIRDQGFANCVVNGTLATYLELTDSERLAAKKAVDEARREYLEAMSRAQITAISQIKKTLGGEKASMLEKQLEPLLANNGVLWKVDMKHLDTNRFSSHTLFPLPHISQVIKDQTSGDDK